MVRKREIEICCRLWLSEDSVGVAINRSIRSSTLLSLPLYMVEELPRILDEIRMGKGA